jgi:PIN domain nuclease of toxin-antitoxin system
MGLLLDTCAAIWIAEGALSPAGKAALDAAYRNDEVLSISPITAWEFAIMAAKGRLASPLSPLGLFERFSVRPDVVVVDLSPSILVSSCLLPNWPAKDPADRIIVATARELGLSVLTRDRTILAYARSGYVLATPC